MPVRRPSKLIKRITSEDPDERMPPESPPLPDKEFASCALDRRGLN